MQKFRFLLFSILILLSAILFESVIDIDSFGKNDIKRFQKEILKKQSKLNQIVQSVSEKDIIISPNHICIQEIIISQLSKQSGASLFLYENDTLTYWSDHSVPAPESYKSVKANAILLSNAWYIVEKKEFGDYSVLGLTLIKNSYPYENRFLQNDFQDDLNISSSIKISTKKSENGIDILNNKNEYLFSLILPNELLGDNKSSISVFFLYVFAVSFFLLFLHVFIKDNFFPGKEWKLLIIVGLIIIIRFLMIRYSLPGILYSYHLFSPKLFAVSAVLPSLGDLLINSLFFLFVLYEFYTHFKFNNESKNALIEIVREIVLFAVLIIYFIYINYVFRNLIFNSSISFEAFRVLNLSFSSFIGFLIIGIQFISFIILLEKTYSIISLEKSLIKIFLRLVFVSGPLFLIWYFISGYYDISSIVLFYLITYFILLTQYKKRAIYQFTSISVLVIFFALYSVYFINSNTVEKEKNERKVLAISLATEHDPVAEIFLPELEEDLRNDTLLNNLIFDEDIDFMYLNEYLKKKYLNEYLKKRYFNGFWTKYDFQFVICSPLDSIYIEPPDDEFLHCYSFFDNMVGREGIQLTGSNFYFLDNLNGRISYFGSIDFLKDINSLPITLFIDINSKLFSKELGFPELLLEEKYSRKTSLDKYSYAKYNSNKLISQNGPFQYNLSINSYQSDSVPEFEYFSLENYDHLIYQIDELNSIIISKPSTSYLDLLISLSYVFLFFYLLASFFIVISKSMVTLRLDLSFKDRIQSAMLFILLLSLLVVGGGTIYFSIQQYKRTHNAIIAEKIQSVYIELEHVLEFEENLRSEWQTRRYDNLNELLIKFSNIFYTDINLFDKNGDLLATSRPEIYSQGIISRKMNIDAYHELSINKKTEYIHNENIGELKYLSGYVPFINKDNKFLAYLNLPYFTKQSLFRKEISTLVIAIVNIYVLLLILSLGLSFIISNKLTLPLKFIKNRISQLDLGKSYEKIEYEGTDEIGSLVAEYNKKVEELKQSVNLLAQSERESAWKEMAKQIAHEIKNPLTPIKLSVQHLNKAWKDKKENWDEHLEKFTSKMIDQIETLSTIATEFSNFAKMPDANNKRINLATILDDAQSLFENTENITIRTNIESEKVYVFADKEQLSRVFINLIKNAIQSMPKNIQGVIQVNLRIDENIAVTEIIDNGSGITEELQDKLFQPNFTTKTSGMGLGLSIVKKIVEDCKGRIYFESKVDEGTKFIVEIPLIKDE